MPDRIVRSGKVLVVLAVLACRPDQFSAEGSSGPSTTESSGSASDGSTTDAEESETGDGDPLPPAPMLLMLTDAESPNPTHSLHVLDVHAEDPAASLTLLAQDRWSVRGGRADGLTLSTNWDACELALLDLDTQPPTWHPIELPAGNEAFYGRWVPDEQEIMLVARDTNLDSERIWRVAVDVAGVPSTPELLTPATEPGFETELFVDGLQHEAFSEDGKTLAFFGRVGPSGPWQVYVLDLEDPDGNLLRLSELTDFTLIPSLHLTPDGGELVYADQGPEGTRLWWVDLDDGSTTSELIVHYPGYVYTYQWINPRALLLEINCAALAVLEIGEDGPAITPIDTGDVTPNWARSVDGGDWLLVVGLEPGAEEHTLYRMSFDGLVAGPLEPLAGAALGEPNLYSISMHLDPQLISLSLGQDDRDFESTSYEIHIAQLQDGELVERWLLGHSRDAHGSWSVQDNRLVSWLQGYGHQLYHLDLDEPEAVGLALTPIVSSSVKLDTIVRAPATDRVLFLQGTSYSTLELKMVELDAPEQVTTISPPERYAVEAYLVPRP